MIDMDGLMGSLADMRKVFIRKQTSSTPWHGIFTKPCRKAKSD